MATRERHPDHPGSRRVVRSNKNITGVQTRSAPYSRSQTKQQGEGKTILGKIKGFFSSLWTGNESEADQPVQMNTETDQSAPFTISEEISNKFQGPLVTNGSLQGNFPAPQISTPSKQDNALNQILAKSTLTPEEYEKITQELLQRVSETPVKEPKQQTQPFPFSTPASAKKPMAVHSTPVTTIDVGKLIMDKSSPARSKMIQQQHQAKKQLPKFSDTFKVSGSAFNLPLAPQPEISVNPSWTPSRRQYPATPSVGTPSHQFKTPQPFAIQQQTPSRLEVVSTLPKTSWRDFNVQFTPDVQAKAASENEELRQIPNSRKRRHPTDENLVQPEEDDTQYRPIKRRALDTTPMPSTPRASLSSSGVFTTPSSVPTSVTARKILQTIGRITSPVSDASEPIYRSSGYASSPMGSLTGSAKRKRSDLKARTPRVKVSTPMFTEEDEMEDAPPSDSLTSEYDTRVKRATIPAARVSSARKIFKVKRNRMEESSDEDYSFEQTAEVTSKPKQQEPAPKKSFDAVEVLSSDESSSEEDKPLRKKQKSDASVEKPAEKVQFKINDSKPATKAPSNGFDAFEKPSEKQSAVAKEKKDEVVSTPFVFNASMKDKNDSFYTDDYEFKQPQVSTDKKFTSDTVFGTTFKFGENTVSLNDDKKEEPKKEEAKKEEPKKTEAPKETPKEAPKSLFTFTPEKTSGVNLDFMKEPEKVPSTLSFSFTTDKSEASSIASGFSLTTPKLDEAKSFTGFTLPSDTKKTETPEKEKEKPFSGFAFGDKKETEKEKESAPSLSFSFTPTPAKDTEAKTDAPSLGFSVFNTDKKTDSPSLTFSFTSDKKEETKEKEDKPAASGFTMSFGKDESKDKTTSTLGFSFTSEPEKTKETSQEKKEEKKKDELVSTPFVFNASMKDKNDSFYTDEYEFKQPQVTAEKKFTSETTFPTTIKFGENAVSVNDDDKKEEPKKEEPKKEEKKEEEKKESAPAAGFSFTMPAASDKKEAEKESSTGFTGFSFAPSTPAAPAKDEEKKPEEKEESSTGFGFNFTPSGNAFKFGADAKTDDKKPEEKKPEEKKPETPAAASTLFGTSTPVSSWNPTPAAAPTTTFTMPHDEDSMADDDVKPAASTPAAPSTGANSGFGFSSISTPFGTPVTAAPSSGFSFTLTEPPKPATSSSSSGAPAIFMFGDDSSKPSAPSSTPAFGQSTPASTPFSSSISTPFGTLPATQFGSNPVTFSAPSPTFGQPAQSPTGFNPNPAPSNAPFGSSTPAFGSSTPSAPFGSSSTPFGGSNAPFGASAPSSTPTFGSSTPAFGSTPSFGSSTPSTPAFGSFNGGAPSTPAFGASPFGSGATSTPFSGFGGGNAAANPFAVSSTPAPAASSSSGFDMFANNNSHTADEDELRRRKIVKARTQKKFQNN